EEILKLEDLVEVRNWKAVGQKLGYARIYSVEEIAQESDNCEISSEVHQMSLFESEKNEKE
ncbi:MAG: hypothetical protein RML94_16595, partial [Bacteroidia bacterium]|nr:hypothetical protein [Bacteroidia bacterium]